MATIESDLQLLINALKKGKRNREFTITNLTNIHSFLQESRNSINPSLYARLIKQTIKAMSHNKESEQIVVLGLTLINYLIQMSQHERQFNHIFDFTRTFPITFQTPAIQILIIALYEFLINNWLDAPIQYFLNFSCNILNNINTNIESFLFNDLHIVCLRVILWCSDKPELLDIITKQYFPLIFSIATSLKDQNIQLLTSHILCRCCRSFSLPFDIESIFLHFISRLEPSNPDLSPVISALWSLTSVEGFPVDFIDKLTEILVSQPQDVVIVENCFAILSNYVRCKDKSFLTFGNEELYNAVITNALFFQNNISCQRYAFHMLRTASFRTDFTPINFVALVISSMTTHRKNEMIVEDGCVICYNLYQRGLLDEEKAKVAINLALDSFKENKIIYAIHYAIEHEMQLDFV
ncbi:Uncharacterized protein QTN25_010052 [Entamoeba marina]